MIHQIHQDQAERQHQKVYEALPISIFEPNSSPEGLTSTGLNGQFIHSQLLIDCLVRMKPTANESQEFIAFCKQNYEDNPKQLKYVEEFEREYTPKKSVWWYTRHTFLYQLLNKALRVQNIDMLYLFRFYIRDLKQELEKYKCKAPVHVYRVQQMSKEEIEKLQKSVGQYVSMNSFFSTSADQAQARTFVCCENVSDDTEQVFFQIDADPRLDNIKPFADIKSLSRYPDEKEVLFMIGSIFQVIEIKRDSDQVWNIRLKLCSENGHELQRLFEHMSKKLNIAKIDVYEFSQILYDMGKLNEAEKYFRIYLDGLPAGHPSIAAAYQGLGMIADDKGEYEASLEWYNKALDIELKLRGPSHQNVATIYNCIAIIHERAGDYALAKESYKKALQIRIKVYGQDHPHVAMCMVNVGGLYQREKQFSKALESYNGALLIYDKRLPPGHPHLGKLHSNIGNLHARLGDYNRALEHHNRNLYILEKSLPPDHRDIASALESIGNIYEAKKDLSQALSHYEQALKIFRKSLSSTHPRVVTADEEVKRVSSKLK